METNNIAVVVGYIMYYDMLEDKINGSFYSKIDKAIEIAKDFCSTFSAEEKSNWVGDLNFEDELEKFIKNIK
jgi:hypothetical protein